MRVVLIDSRASYVTCTTTQSRILLKTVIFVLKFACSLACYKSCFLLRLSLRVLQSCLSVSGDHVLVLFEALGFFLLVLFTVCILKLSGLFGLLVECLSLDQ